MINGLGVVGWGVGGIEAEAGDARPAGLLPDARRRRRAPARAGSREGVTATDLVLRVTELLRKAKVVGKFVEFFGEGAASLSGARPRDDRQHGARVRRDHGLLPGRRGDLPVPARDRPRAPSTSRRSAATTRRRGCSASPRSGEIDYSERPRARSRQRRAERRRSQAAAGPHRPGRAQGTVSASCFASPSRERLRQSRGRRSTATVPGWPTGRATPGRRRAGASTTPDGPRATTPTRSTESEMINNRPTPNRSSVRARPGGRRRSTSATATW